MSCKTSKHDQLPIAPKKHRQSISTRTKSSPQLLRPPLGHHNDTPSFALIMTFPNLLRAAMALRSSLRASSAPNTVTRPWTLRHFESRYQYRYKSTNGNGTGNKTPPNAQQKPPKKETAKAAEEVFEKDDRPFHFQMWDSTAARVQREKDRQRQMLTKLNREGTWLRPIVVFPIGELYSLIS